MMLKTAYSKINPVKPNFNRYLSFFIQHADIAIGSLTITAEREKAIDFTKPFMDFTMSLIMEKPPEAAVDIFAFLQPFNPELWVSVVAVVSIIIFNLVLLYAFSIF